MQVRTIYSDEHTENDIALIKQLLANNPNDLGIHDLEGWETKNSSFLYVFLKTNRFSKENGGVVLVEDNGELSGMSGFNRSDFDPAVFILGARTIIDQKFRHELYMSTYIIPAQMAHVSGQAKMILFLFDTDNPFSLYHVFVNSKLNLFLKDKLASFAALYDGLTALPFPVTVNNTTQNVLYIKLDRAFDFDWNRIKANV